MSRFDSNPFDEESGRNPYAGTAAPPASGGSFFSKMSFGKGSSAFSAAEADAGVTPNAKDLERKEQELQALELALKKKEQEIAQQEAQSGVELKNFPPFMPLIHHDIANDIPDNRKPLQRLAFFSWLGIMLCLVYNLVGAIISWAAGTFTFTDGIGNFFLALIYVICGVPLSYFLWYRPLYVAMRKQGIVSFTMFFVFYAIHIAFCVFATIAPPFVWHGSSFTGYISGINVITNGWTVVGIIYLVGAGLFTLESLISVYVMGKVFAHFRNRK